MSSLLYEQAQCTNCEPNYYCPGGEAITHLCPPGYYCPMNTRFAEEYPCPNGTYNPHYGKGNVNECQPCPMGHFCEKATVQPYECPIGTFMSQGYDTKSSTLIGTPAGNAGDCVTCPAGLYCLNATVTPKNCGVGFYTSAGQSMCQVHREMIFLR